MKSIKSAGFPLFFLLPAIILLSHPSGVLLAQLEREFLVNAEEVEVIPGNLIVFGLIAAGVYDTDMVINDVGIYKITYNTIDVFGNPTVASGAMYVPLIDADSIPIISYQHGTVMDREEVPSRRSDDPAGLFYAGNGYITTLPDYLGLGDHPGLHPYLHWESEATATIDLIRAAREFLNDSLLIWDNHLFITGYSQGGHAAMAAHKYIHMNDLQSEFRVTASAPMSGSYPLSSTQFEHIFSKDSTYNGSYYIPYIIASYQYVYGNLYDDPSHYYDPPYDSIFAAWELSGNFFEDYPMGSLPKNFYEFMQDSVMENLLEDFNHPLRIALRKNDLHNWAPQEPVRLIYCGMDDVVPPLCATTTRDTMQMLGAPDVLAVSAGAEYNHGSCALPAFLYALDWFDSMSKEQALFNGEIPAVPEIRLYPNPVNTLLTVETGAIGRTFVEIHSINGQLVYQSHSERNIHQIDFTSLRKGIYFITIRSGDFVATRKIVKH